MILRSGVSPRVAIGPLARGEKPDRGNAEVAQDLRTEPDLAPLALARRRRRGCQLAVRHRYRHAGGPVAQIDEHAAAVLLEAGERAMDRLAVAEHVAQH